MLKRLVALLVTLTLVVAPAVAPASASTAPSEWIRKTAIPLNTADPRAPLTDLASLRRSIGTATTVGLGESVHGAAEELTLKHRVLRLLVEELGFRSIAWEEDWTTGVLIDAYIRTGQGNLDDLVGRMTPQWQSREVADVLRYLRDYNARHADKVSFVGIDFWLTGLLAYDTVAAYVTDVAPHQLPALQANLVPITPEDDNIFAHIGKYQDQPDKPRYIRHARAVYDLIARIPHRAGDPVHATVLHHAEQIVRFYVMHSLEGDAPHLYRDAYAAKNLSWWRSHSKTEKIVYWAASPHVAVDNQLRIVMPPRPDLRFAGVGWYVRQQAGARYRSIGFTFDHGTISGGPGRTVVAPAPKPHWFEKAFGGVPYDQFAVDLREPAPPSVREWLNAPVTTRAPDAGPDSFVTGTSLGQWFDVIVHRQLVSPSHPSPGAARAVRR